MITCFLWRGSLDSYADGELTGFRRSLLERHLAGCESCRAGVEATRNLDAQLRSIPEDHSHDPEAVALLARLHPELDRIDREEARSGRKLLPAPAVRESRVPAWGSLAAVGACAALLGLWVLPAPSRLTRSGSPVAADEVSQVALAPSARTAGKSAGAKPAAARTAAGPAAGKDPTVTRSSTVIASVPPAGRAPGAGLRALEAEVAGVVKKVETLSASVHEFGEVARVEAARRSRQFLAMKKEEESWDRPGFAR